MLRRSYDVLQAAKACDVSCDSGMMRPLQVWVPSLGGSIYLPEVERDARRAFDAWQGEGTVFLLPDLKAPVRWPEGGSPRPNVLAIPAERFERLDVYHVAENGEIAGKQATVRFPGANVEGLLDAWLNTRAELYTAPNVVTVSVPSFEGREVQYRDVTVPRPPRPAIPVVHVDEETHSLTVRWPPEAPALRTVSPEAESRERYGNLRRIDVDGLPLLLSPSDPSYRSLDLLFRWPEPLAHVYPLGAGIDDLAEHATMIQLARKSTENLQGVLREASNSAASYIAEGQSTLELVWWWPRYFATVRQGLAIENLLFDLESRFGIAASTLEEAMASNRWKEVASRPIPVRRVWTATGLFYALLLDRLEQRRPFCVCARCNRIIRGSRGKKYCGPKDNEACFLERRAEDQRRSRSRR